MSQAAKRFKDFHGRNPRGTEVARVVQDAPEDTLLVGEFYGIMYKVRGIREPYLHRFKAPKGQVRVSADGRQIYIVGGNYRFTDRGFIG